MVDQMSQTCKYKAEDENILKPKYKDSDLKNIPDLIQLPSSL